MKINFNFNENNTYNTNTNDLKNKEIPIYENIFHTSFKESNIINNNKINNNYFYNYNNNFNDNKNIYSSFSQNNNYNNLIFKESTITLDNNKNDNNIYINNIPNTYIQNNNYVNYNNLPFNQNNYLINNNDKIYNLETNNNNYDNIKYNETFLYKENPNINNMAYSQIFPDKNFKIKDENISNLITNRVEDNKNYSNQMLSYQNISKNTRINLNKNSAVPISIKKKNINGVGNIKLIVKKLPKKRVLPNVMTDNNLINKKIDLNNKILKNLDKNKEISKEVTSTQTKDFNIDYNISKVPVDDFRSKTFQKLRKKIGFKGVKVIKVIPRDIFKKRKNNVSAGTFNIYNIYNNNHINNLNNLNISKKKNIQNKNYNIKKFTNYNTLDSNSYKRGNYSDNLHIKLKYDEKKENKNKEIIKKIIYINNDFKIGKNSYNNKLNNIQINFNNKIVRKIRKIKTQKILKNKNSKNNKVKELKINKFSKNNNYKLDESDNNFNTLEKILINI